MWGEEEGGEPGLDGGLGSPRWVEPVEKGWGVVLVCVWKLVGRLVQEM